MKAQESCKQLQDAEDQTESSSLCPGGWLAVGRVLSWLGCEQLFASQVAEAQMASKQLESRLDSRSLEAV